MAFRLVFWPNRKSKNGSRALSRVPRRHRVPAWSTNPPVMKMTEQLDTAAPLRPILRRLIETVTDPSDDQKRRLPPLDDFDDVRLAELAQEAIAVLKRIKAQFDGTDAELKDMRVDVARIKTQLAEDRQKLAEARKAIVERDDLAVKFKELQKQLDPERAALETMYAVDAALVKAREEIAGLQRELAQSRSEVDNLRASKKRLREALDRLAGKD